MKSSVFISRLAVASSKTIIFFLYNKILAKQINYFYPTENIELISLISVNKPFVNYLVYSYNPETSNAFQIS